MRTTQRLIDAQTLSHESIHLLTASVQGYREPGAKTAKHPGWVVSLLQDTYINYMLFRDIILVSRKLRGNPSNTDML